MFRLTNIARFAFISLAWALMCHCASAITLDWDAASWTNGSLTGSNSGVDITVTSTSPTFQGSTVAPSPMTPAITRAFDGGLSPGEKSLELSIDFPNQAQNHFITVTITFNAAVYASGAMDVSFKLFDIDYDNANSTYQDRIFNISATTVGGAPLTPTVSNLGSAVNYDSNSRVLTGTSSVVDLNNAGSGNGNAQINVNESFIRSITFSYGASTAFNNPTYQHIGIHDINFTPVPEVNPALAAGGVCAVALVVAMRRRAALARKSDSV